MRILSRSARLGLSFLLLAATPARAASPATEAFLANVVPNVDFLDRSSRFALDNSKNARLRAFAHDEAREQTLAANALYDWTQTAASPIVASTSPDSPGHVPATTDLDQTPTGSTGVRPEPAPANPDTMTDDRLPRGQEDLDSLEGLEGKAFDTEYKDKQRDALQQVLTDYADYLAKGDDPGLLAIAKSEKPKIEKRLALLGKI